VRTFWLEHAVVDGVVRQGVRVEEVDGVISSVADDAPAPEPGDIALNGLTLPGIANGHSHAFHRALRGRTHADGGDFWAAQVRAIAEQKQVDLNANDVEAAMKIIAGTARSMGITVEA